jgi:hypothetical protein
MQSLNIGFVAVNIFLSLAMTGISYSIVSCYEFSVEIE